MPDAKPTLRHITRDDLDAIARLTAEAWYDLAPDGAPAELSLLAATHEACTFMADMTWGVVAERGNETLGVIACSTGDPDATERAWWQAAGEQALAQARAIDPKATTEACAPVTDEERAVEEMVAEARLAGVPRVLLLVVSQHARGLGLGRRLLGKAAAHFAATGDGRYWLATDTCCDWPFYEHLGMRRLAERTGGVPGGPERYFIYGA